MVLRKAFGGLQFMFRWFGAVCLFWYGFDTAFQSRMTILDRHHWVGYLIMISSFAINVPNKRSPETHSLRIGRGSVFGGQ